jgi:hypothetical protein
MLFFNVSFFWFKDFFSFEQKLTNNCETKHFDANRRIGCRSDDLMIRRSE